MTILFIDDDEDVSRWYRKALEHRRCLVIFCPTVEDALTASARNERFHVIVIDMMMPWGPYSPSSTGGGLRTGKVLYEDLSKRHHDAAMIILTTLQPNQLPADLNGGRVRICNKTEYPPREFAELVLGFGPQVYD